jgi:hypothetical protein
MNFKQNGVSLLLTPFSVEGFERSEGRIVSILEEVVLNDIVT